MKFRPFKNGENIIMYHDEILIHFEKIFNIGISSNYRSDINTMDYFITDEETGGNKISFDGNDYDIGTNRTPIEQVLSKLYDYLNTVYGKSEDIDFSNPAPISFNCPNCSASLKPYQKVCNYCGTHFNYVSK